MKQTSTIMNFSKSLALVVIAAFTFQFTAKAQFSTNSGNTTTFDNVGVGTTAPWFKTEIFGISQYTANMSDAGSRANILAINGSTADGGSGGAITFGNVQSNNAGSLGFAAIKGLLTDGSANTKGDLAFSTRNSTSATTLTERMRIAVNGNIGISTTTPSSKFSIGTSAANPSVDFLVSNTNPQQIFEATGAQTNQKLWDFLVDGGAGAFVGRALNDGNSAGNSWLVVNRSGYDISNVFFPAGNVGIGTTDTHGYKLAVNGTIRSKEIKVEASPWPDYVFKPTYKLTPLAEVKAYIDKNQHLPEMPSAAKVEKEGLNLGEMNRLLLKKVEELTLYLIEQKKEITELKSEMKTLKESKK